MNILVECSPVLYLDFTSEDMAIVFGAAVAKGF